MGNPPVASVIISAKTSCNCTNCKPLSAEHIPSKVLNVTSTPFISTSIPLANPSKNWSKPSPRSCSKQAFIALPHGSVSSPLPSVTAKSLLSIHTNLESLSEPMKIGKPSEAKDYFDKAIKIDSNYVKSYVNKGIIFLDEKNYDMALSLFKKAIELDKEDVEAHSNMGITLGQLKRYSEAIDSFDEALKLQPENGYIHYNKSLALSILERYIEATEHWNLYLKFKNNQGQFTTDFLKVEE